MTDFKNGLTSRGIPTEAGIDPSLMIPGKGGRVVWVNSTPPTGVVSNNTNNGRDRQHPMATLEGAEALCTAGAGDVVLVEPTHVETWATAAASANLSKSGVRWVFLGKGALRPTFTLGHVDATLTISAANVVVKGYPILTPSVDDVVAAVTVSAANVEVEVETRDLSGTVEFIRALLTSAGADHLFAKIKHVGVITGNAGVNVVRLVGTDNARIVLDAYGIFSTAAVEFITTLSSNVYITGYVYNSGTTDGSKLVVNTGGLAATWYADIEDGAAGRTFSGGSASALASDDVSTVAANLATLQAEVSGAAGLVTFPAGVAAANAVSLAEVLRYLQENVILGAGTVLPTGASLWGALAGASGIPTYPAAAAPANDVSLAEVLRDIWDALRNGTGGTEPGTNKSLADAIGFDGVAAIAASAGMARVRNGTTFIMKKTLTSSAVLAAGVDVTAISTVGDILIEDFILQTDGTGLAAGTAFTLETNNAKGLSVFASHAVASLGAQALIDKKTATVGKGTVLETGKKIIAKCTGVDCTGAGTIDVYLLCRRLADNATLAAA